MARSNRQNCEKVASSERKIRKIRSLRENILGMRFKLSLVLVGMASLASAARAQYLGGDPIGADSSFTDNTGGFTAVRDNGDNLGQPAVLTTFTGDELLTELRVVVFGIPSAEGDLRFDNFDYRLDIWRSEDYFAGSDAEHQIVLGDAEGINLISEGAARSVPENSFGTAGVGGYNSKTYDFRFDLTQLPPGGAAEGFLSSPLPAGDWVLGFQSWHDTATNGTLRVSGSAATQGPLPLFSREDSVARRILGNQDPENVSLYWGISVASVPATSTALAGDFDFNGTVDAADYTVWRDGLTAVFDEEDYEIWQSNFGLSVTGGLSGDFDHDGIVNASDYTNWRDNLGNATESVLSFAGDGLDGVDNGDYSVWRQHFGYRGDLRSSPHSVVPEPAGFILLICYGLRFCHLRNPQ